MKQRVRSLGCLARLSEYSESSLILRFFTRDLGAVSVLAKGIRRAQTRNQLMALGEYELNLYPPTESGLYLLGEISSVKERDLSASPQHWAAADCALELLSSLIIPTDESPVYYALLDSYLDFLQTRKGSAILLWWRFLLRVFNFFGTPFDPLACGLCQTTEENIAAWDRGTGALFCHNCLATSENSDAHARLSSASSKLLRLLPSIGNYLDELRPLREEVKELNQLFADFFFAHFNYPLKLKSLQVLEQFYPPARD